MLAAVVITRSLIFDVLCELFKEITVFFRMLKALRVFISETFLTLSNFTYFAVFS
jgi:hypothetical protein